MFVKNLIGHSGCQLALISGADGMLVRKQADVAYNYRLKRQCIKQSKFQSTTVAAPKILSKGYQGDAFYFDMEYIQGKTLASTIAHLTVKEIFDLVKVLFKNLCLSEIKDENVNRVFLNKINSLPNPQNTDVCDLFNQAKKCLLAYDFSYVYKSPCHGDLTLENIIITPSKKLYLIDFLDSFYNSWIIDVAKLLQDVELKWSYRYEKPDMTRDIRLLVAKNALLEELRKMKNGQKIIETVYYVLLLNILRIYPYAKDAVTIDFLKNSTQKTINIINSLKGEKI